MKNILIIISFMFLLVSCFWWSKPDNEFSSFFIEVNGIKGAKVNITYLGYIDTDGSEVQSKTVTLPYIDNVGINRGRTPWISVTNTSSDTVTVYFETDNAYFTVDHNCRYFYLLGYNQYPDTKPNPEAYKDTPCVFKITLDSAHVLLKKSDYPYFKLVAPNETVKLTVKE